MYLTDYSQYYDDLWMFENNLKNIGINQKMNTNVPLHGAASTFYHDRANRGFGFGLIDPGAMANAFEMGAAILQFVHESSVKYAEAVLREEAKRRKLREVKNRNKQDTFSEDTSQTIGKK